jgi:hypothetical protein
MKYNYDFIFIILLLLFIIIIYYYLYTCYPRMLFSAKFGVVGLEHGKGNVRSGRWVSDIIGLFWTDEKAACILPSV